MVVKWSNMDKDIGVNDSNLIDDYIKMSKNFNQNFNQSKLHYLNGYLYESPTHKGVACWRALDDFHKLENIKHLLAAVDFETDFKSTYQPNYTHPFALNFEHSLFPKSNQINYHNNYLSKSSKTKTSIYEGCYNAHDLQTSLAIQKTLNNIYDTLNKSYERKHTSKKITDASKSIHETRLLNEYQKLKSNIESSSQTISSKRTSTKSQYDFEEIKSEKSSEKLEQESLNKIEDDLKSNCENDFDDESSISSSSSRVFYQKTKSAQTKKYIPPKRNRHRVMSHLDKELSSSDLEVKKKADSKTRQSAFKPVADQQFLESKSNKKPTIDKTDEELISEFEKLSPINFNKLNNSDKTKIEELYNDLKSNKSNKSNDSVSIKLDTKSPKNSERESVIKIKSSNEQVEQTTTKTNIQIPTSPENVNDHLIEVYQAGGNKKPIAPKAPQVPQAYQRPKGPTKLQPNQPNSGKIQRPIYYANDKNNDMNSSKNNRNPSIKEIIARVRQKVKAR
ncbi:hypothetical protein BpHYR1_036853 [Brachionus plicatilis]|uniref:Uncharacterized protein n=1 Tax=Brachionus plicatilis TaxID=10195 RepID=A0A3M7RP24_BRAPC|nr:hypothetical protein BpHYR1_036853 [Brachionus plicatilis]